MSGKGFIKLHRSFMDCSWYNDVKMRVMFPQVGLNTNTVVSKLVMVIAV